MKIKFEALLCIPYKGQIRFGGQFNPYDLNHFQFSKCNRKLDNLFGYSVQDAMCRDYDNCTLGQRITIHTAVQFFFKQRHFLDLKPKYYYIQTEGYRLDIQITKITR